MSAYARLIDEAPAFYFIATRIVRDVERILHWQFPDGRIPEWLPELQAIIDRVDGVNPHDAEAGVRE